MKSVLDANPDPTDDEIREEARPAPLPLHGLRQDRRGVPRRRAPAPRRDAPSARRLGPRRDEPRRATRPRRSRSASGRSSRISRFPGCSTAPSRSRPTRAPASSRIDTSAAARHPGVARDRDRAGRAGTALLRPHRPGLARLRGRGRGDALRGRRPRRGRGGRRAHGPRRRGARRRRRTRSSRP